MVGASLNVASARPSPPRGPVKCPFVAIKIDQHLPPTARLMRAITTTLAALLLFACVPASANAQETDGLDRTYRGPRLFGHTFRVVEVSWANLPLKGRYADLTEPERTRFKAQYEDMPAGDEPPYPREGLERFISNVATAAAAVRDQGLLKFFVTVDSDGNVASVSMAKTDSVELAAAIGGLFRQTKFKPARCGEAACRMDFPLTLKVYIEP